MHAGWQIPRNQRQLNLPPPSIIYCCILDSPHQSVSPKQLINLEHLTIKQMSNIKKDHLTSTKGSRQVNKPLGVGMRFRVDLMGLFTRILCNTPSLLYIERQLPMYNVYLPRSIYFLYTSYNTRHYYSSKRTIRHWNTQQFIANSLFVRGCKDVKSHLVRVVGELLNFCLLYDLMNITLGVT